MCLLYFTCVMRSALICSTVGATTLAETAIAVAIAFICVKLLENHNCTTFKFESDVLYTHFTKRQVVCQLTATTNHRLFCVHKIYLRRRNMLSYILLSNRTI